MKVPRSPLSAKRTKRLVRALGIQAEVRGKDATGIGYFTKGEKRVFKQPIPASQFPFAKSLTEDVQAVIGHTRLATQGSATDNKNNHPFEGTDPEGKGFIMAHNGVIWNDMALQQQYSLPITKVATDSYVAVQLAEERGVTEESLKGIAEELRGSFVLTYLLENNDVYWVVNENPVYILVLKELGLVLYASTLEILRNALKKDRALLKYVLREQKEKTGKATIIAGKTGEIIKLAFATGEFSTSTFIPQTFSTWYRSGSAYNWDSTSYGYSYGDYGYSYGDYGYGYGGNYVKDKNGIWRQASRIKLLSSGKEKPPYFSNKDNYSYVDGQETFVLSSDLGGTAWVSVDEAAGQCHVQVRNDGKITTLVFSDIETYYEWEELFTSEGADVALSFSSILADAQ